MKLPTYTSLTAFLEHYRALESSASRSPYEENIFNAMKQLVAEIGAMPSAESATETATDRRHRERACIRLRRELAARGVLAS